MTLDVKMVVIRDFLALTSISKYRLFISGGRYGSSERII